MPVGDAVAAAVQGVHVELCQTRWIADGKWVVGLGAVRRAGTWPSLELNAARMFDAEASVLCSSVCYTTYWSRVRCEASRCLPAKDSRCSAGRMPPWSWRGLGSVGWGCLLGLSGGEGWGQRPLLRGLGRWPKVTVAQRARCITARPRRVRPVTRLQCVLCAVRYVGVRAHPYGQPQLLHPHGPPHAQQEGTARVAAGGGVNRRAVLVRGVLRTTWVRTTV